MRDAASWECAPGISRSVQRVEDLEPSHFFARGGLAGKGDEMSEWRAVEAPRSADLALGTTQYLVCMIGDLELMAKGEKLE